ncbi:TPA: helix-turn-helix domain-containing protein [Klebsiella oxytoca]|uniref:Helix-turn-helix domain-containing protein n=1 Tax=Klebsiella oxytoca TaxID=571 RepID=A0AAN5REZ5_KLEOX|nr:helix-turn-helix domain-containing protein [Klebsiella oxytoca]
MSYLQPTTDSLSIIDKTQKLNDLLFVVSQALNKCGEETKEIETCMNIAWSLGNSISNDLVALSHHQPTNNSGKSSPAHPAVNAPASTSTVEDPDTTIGNRIQIAREKLGLSKAELASKLNVTYSNVDAWETGITEPSSSMVIPLSRALKCDPMWLLAGESVPHAEAAPAPVEVMKDVDVSTIGKRIGVARVAKHMNTQELEDAIDAPDGTVFRWETGKTIPSSQYIDCLARILNVSVTWLLTGKETTQEGAVRQNGEYAGKQNHHVAQPAGAVSHEALQR